MECPGGRKARRKELFSPLPSRVERISSSESRIGVLITL